MFGLWDMTTGFQAFYMVFIVPGVLLVVAPTGRVRQ